MRGSVQVTSSNAAHSKRTTKRRYGRTDNKSSIFPYLPNWLWFYNTALAMSHGEMRRKWKDWRSANGGQRQRWLPMCACAWVRRTNERRDAEPNLAAKAGSSALFTHNDPLKRLILRELWTKRWQYSRLKLTIILWKQGNNSMISHANTHCGHGW